MDVLLEVDKGQLLREGWEIWIDENGEYYTAYGEDVMYF